MDCLLTSMKAPLYAERQTRGRFVELHKSPKTLSVLSLFPCVFSGCADNQLLPGRFSVRGLRELL